MSEPDNSTVVARIEELKKAIAVQETLRGSIGDAVVDTTVGALKNQITELQARLSLSGRQRKQITVLFADLVGYTALSESIDPEDLGEIMNVLWSRVDQIILRYGGRIDKHIGDAVMALWGVESAREDDPANAVQAALSMHQQVRELCDTQFSKFCEHTESLALRIGVHTGPVLLGELGTTGEYTAVGDTVNTTNRLEQAAAPGSTFISHETYHQIRGVFEIRAIGKVRAKGKDDLLAYQVLSARPHAFHTITRGIVGVSTPMIGRESELNQLKSAISSVVNESCSKIVTIIGDPGVGKSRLLYEFQDWLDTLPLDLHHLRGRAAHQIMAEPYRLLRDLFSDYCGILDSDPASEARSKLEAGVSPFFAEEPQMKAHLIGALLGFDYSTSTHVLGIKDDPKQLRSRAIFYLLQWFAAFTDQKPTVLLLDDVHWADSASLEAIFHLISEQPGLKLLMICLARPVIFETFPQWKDWQPEPSDNQIQINLSPLTRQDSQHLVD